MAGTAHHLIDIIEPDQAFSLADYRRLAYIAIDDITSRGKLPLLAGGSGQYVRAVLENWDIPPVVPDESFRSQLEERAARGEAEAIYMELQKADPTVAGRIDRRNVRRVIRALEISRQGRPEAGTRPAPFQSLVIGLTTDRKYLYELIDRRIENMLSAGLVNEVMAALERGYGLDLPALSGIGYRQIGRHLMGETSLEEAVAAVRHDSRRLVRQQYNWFKLKDDRIIWFDVAENPYSAISVAVKCFLGAD
jgi:tRNA dimethylallyltransferase